jgi:tRNA 2-selenouridine synthase
VLDLEGIAAHKGSAFGGFDGPQPSQEMFENMLALQLHQLTMLNQQPVWVEDESRRIGSVNLPAGLWDQLRTAPLYFLDIPFDERLSYITSGYGKYQKEKLLYSIVRIQKRLGGLETRNAINHLLDDNFRDCFAILLRYYDKFYLKSLHTRDNPEQVLRNIAVPEIHARKIARLLKDI